MLPAEDQLTATKPEVLETFKNGISRIEFWSNGIVYIKINNQVEIQLEDSRWQNETLLARYDGSNGFRVLVEPGEQTSITKEAREYATQPDKGDISRGMAVLVKSLAHRLIINFIIRLGYQKNMKIRMFDSREKAIEWLLSL